MTIFSKRPKFNGKNILIISIIAGILIWSLAIVFGLKIKGIEADSFFDLSALPLENKELATIQENSLISISNPTDPIKPVQTIKMVITGYSSTPWETDVDPFITASGTKVEEGIVANNFLPFGTEIRIPELYGDKIFVVADRMHWRKGYYHLDIWFPDYWQALNFGAKRTYIEILES